MESLVSRVADTGRSIKELWLNTEAVLSEFRGGELPPEKRQDLIQFLEDIEREAEFGLLVYFRRAHSRLDPNASLIDDSHASFHDLAMSVAGVEIVHAKLKGESYLPECEDLFSERFFRINAELDREAAVACEIVASETDKTAAGHGAVLTTLTYLPNELAKQLDTTTATVNEYAKAAGVDTPGRGKKNHRYSATDRLLILQRIRDTASDQMLVRKSKEYLAEIENKSVNRN